VSAHRAALPVLIVVTGAAISLQAFANGRLGAALDSPELAATVNNIVGLACIMVIGTALGVPRRTRQTLAQPRPPGLRRWHLLAGVNGALFVTVTAYAAPRVGIALLTVALVSGQMAGSLGVDAVGLSPAGRQPLSALRVLGALLAIAAVAIGAVGSNGDVEPGLLALAVLAGAGVAFQQSAMGHVARATGQPLAAAGLNLAVGAAALIVVALISTGATPPGGWSAPPLDWIGGVIAAAGAVVMATTVGRLGVLALMLCMVAGQAIGAVVIDLAAPAPGHGVTVEKLISLGLLMTAVLIAGVRRAPAGEVRPAWAATQSRPPGSPAPATSGRARRRSYSP
jgi:bacterial/archaeal transporter family-2 protein